jgi:hypothetical protein
MKQFISILSAAAVLAAAGCVKTVSDTNTFAVSWGKDSVAGRYPRTQDQVYRAALGVITENGVMLQEFIPHDTTNNVRSVLGKVNDRKVWMRVEAVDSKTAQIAVEARTKWGMKDLDLVHQLEKEVALKLASQP